MAEILALDGNGQRLAPLAIRGCSSPVAQQRLQSLGAKTLFGASAHPDAAFAGLYLYFSCFDDAHNVVQDLHTPEGSFWHAIMHRQEPDAFNSGYWFRQVGVHPVFPALFDAAASIEAEHPTARALAMKSKWDPLQFIEYCEEARKNPGSPEEQLACAIQRAEWQILFHFCAEKA